MLICGIYTALEHWLWPGHRLMGVFFFLAIRLSGGPNLYNPTGFRLFLITSLFHRNMAEFAWTKWPHVNKTSGNELAPVFPGEGRNFGKNHGRTITRHNHSLQAIEWAQNLPAVSRHISLYSHCRNSEAENALTLVRAPSPINKVVNNRHLWINLGMV